MQHNNSASFGTCSADFCTWPGVKVALQPSHAVLLVPALVMTRNVDSAISYDLPACRLGRPDFTAQIAANNCSSLYLALLVFCA